MRLACVLLVIAACAAQDREPGASIDGTPVASFEASGCSTESVIALSRQIADEIDCMMPGQFVRFEPGPAIELSGGGVLPYLSADARADLYLAAAEGTTVMRVTSAFRTVVQQYLLRTWFEHGRCGIAAASEPGESNHETGRALDIGNEEAWIAILAAHGWAHPIPEDPVHFEHLASPDARGADVLAFQRLWNRNAPDDAIDEDGSYGAATAARVKRAPAEGFGLGASCAPVARRPRASACEPCFSYARALREPIDATETARDPVSVEAPSRRTLVRW